MHDGMPCDPIQGQCHKGPKIADFNVSPLPVIVCM